MSVEHGWFRQLYGELLDQRELGDRSHALSRHSGRAAVRLEALAPLKRREPGAASGGKREEHRNRLWEMYALGRISDYLLERGGPAGDPAPGTGATNGRRVAADELAVHRRFFLAIGLCGFEHAEAFSPFHHEIFSVVADESTAAVTVEEVLWPGFRFGDLLFCRAGVRVRAPSHLIDADVATTSTLYFTRRRQPRRAHDPSHGWGSNSQWRTAFARFYEDGAGLHLNSDAEIDIGVDPPVPSQRPDPNTDRPIDRRRELLLHRCLVRRPLPPDEGDWYPYSDRLSLSDGGWPLSTDAMVSAR